MVFCTFPIVGALRVVIAAFHAVGLGVVFAFSVKGFVDLANLVFFGVVRAHGKNPFCVLFYFNEALYLGSLALR